MKKLFGNSHNDCFRTDRRYYRMFKMIKKIPLQQIQSQVVEVTKNRQINSPWAETYDHTRKGARLIMAYDKATNTFTGTVENTTNAILQQVRVEIHLFNSQGPNPHGS